MNPVRKFKPAEPVDGTVTPLSDHPEYADALAELQELEKLHAQKLADRKRLIMRAQGARVKRSPVERARDLIAGGRIDAVPVGARIQALDEEIDVLRGAIIEKTRAIDAVARDLTYTESQKLVPQFNEAMRAALRAMEALDGAFNAAADLVAQMRTAGYRPSAIVFPDLAPHGVRLLQADGIKQFRKSLNEMGTL